MLLKQLTDFLESWAPLFLQESYDNCGLLVGHPGLEAKKALITLDVTEDVLKEAADSGCNVIIAHHPLIFSLLKRINGSNATERILIAALKNDIAIYAMHTNLDNVHTGVNRKICDLLGIADPKILELKKGLLRKLVTFCPKTNLEDGTPAPDAVRRALWEAGAGEIGNYDRCSFNFSGTGTFRPLQGADPYIGKVGEMERQEEERIEVIFPVYRQNEIIKKLWEAHPYEEVAYDIVALQNEFQDAGAGMIGELKKPMSEKEFLAHLKKTMKAEGIRHSPLLGKEIKTVAVCGGSGSFLLAAAIAKGADVLVTGDFKYHQFFEAEGRILIADIGHYESEQYTAELIHDKIREKFPNFALSKSKVNTNPINYL